MIIIKEKEKSDKYFNFARELKKLWNMRLAVVPIVIGMPGTVLKGLVVGQGAGRIGNQKTSQDHPN